MRFILIDQLLELDPGRRAVARKTFDASEDFFTDHFPGFPVVPGTLLTECMAQTVGWLLLHHHAFAVKTALIIVERAKFRTWVRPGDECRIEARLLSRQPKAATSDCTIHVGGRRVASAQLTTALSAISPMQAAANPKLSQWMARSWAELSGPSVERETPCA